MPRPIQLPPLLLSKREDMLRRTAHEPVAQALERSIGANNILPFNYFRIGQKVGRSVGRVIIRQADGRTSFGTGFMVAPELMITNYHVFDEEPERSGLSLADVARNSLLEFDFELDEDGLPRNSVVFRLRPDRFLASSRPDALDFALIAVESQAADESGRFLGEFSSLRLIAETGKIVLDEKMTIIHHPKGESKAISIRDNRLLSFVDENYITYETDTERGSSGAPIFNDQWLVVALHHQSVAARNEAGEVLNKDGSVHQPGQADEQVDWVANAGIRISAIIRDLKTQFPSGNARLDPLFIPTDPDEESIPPTRELPEPIAPFVPSLTPDVVMVPSNSSPNTGFVVPVTDPAGQVIQFTVPLEISIRVGALQSSTPVSPVIPVTPETPNEKVRSVASYANRNGYNPSFLGTSIISLENLLKPIADQLAPTLDQKPLLQYRNFSVAIHKNRRLTALTAVNIDGKRPRSVGRGDNWVLDPRMSERFQTGPTVYSNNDLDRGHMVRRLDPVWGNQAAEANEDTFHYTNSCPQHKDLNQKTWLNLEDFVLNNTKLEKLQVSVFTGPVFGEEDLPYRGVLLPLQFWKVAAVVKIDGKLSMSGYILSQKDLLVDLRESIASDGFGTFRTYQVPLKVLQELTKLDFSSYFINDPLHRDGLFEATSALREISGEDDITL
ncbi:MAG: DNA/RNA non-specific endonuclease [Bacteroidetes bacterium]|nr:DNA/RNA non-specific endonuclease [Fibrella sp.]